MICNFVTEFRGDVYLFFHVRRGCNEDLSSRRLARRAAKSVKAFNRRDLSGLSTAARRIWRLGFQALYESLGFIHKSGLTRKKKTDADKS